MKVDVDRIEPHPFNEKVYQLSNLDELKEDISQVGQLEALTCIKKYGEKDKYVCISGHRRLQALKELKIEQAEINVVKIKKADIPRYIISHNNTRQKTPSERKAEFLTLDKLFKNKSGTRADKKYDRRSEIASIMGISRSQLQKFTFVLNWRKEYFDAYEKGLMTLAQAYRYAKAEKSEAESRADEEIPTVTEKPIDNWTLYYKSSHELKEIEDESIDLICTSPPYYQARAYSNNKNELGLEDTVDEYVENLSNHLDACFRVLSQRGSCWINMGDTYTDGSLVMAPQKLIIELQKKSPWYLRNTVIWYKKNRKPMGKRKVMTPSYEFIFMLTKNKTDYIYDEFTRDTVDSRISLNPRHRNIDGKYYFGKNKVKHFIPKVKSGMIDAWIDEDIVASAVGRHIKEVERIEHAAVFPIELFVKVIENCTTKDSAILDPFMGRGSIGMAMDIVNQSDGGNRKFVGYDLKKYRY